MSRQITIPVLSLAVCMATQLAGAAAPAPSLKDAFQGRFRVGVAVNETVVTAPERDALELIASQFNSVTSENLLKWKSVHPAPQKHHFEPADQFVEFAERHGMSVVGHTLVWHQQTPAWVFEDAQGRPVSRETLLERMREHITTVVGRYRGRVNGWDVVNEALNDDGSLRDTPWRRILGDDYLIHAFRFAQQADPTARLYYNDYNLHLPEKRAAAVRLVETLKRAGQRVDAIGMQSHWGLDYPTLEEVEDSIDAFATVGSVMITELDIDVLPRPTGHTGADLSASLESSDSMDPYKQGLPETVARLQADRYAAFFRVFLSRSDVIDRVTVWGLDDGRSWHNGWPIPGRTSHSLLFDRSQEKKAAFHAVINVAAEADAQSDTR